MFKCFVAITVLWLKCVHSQVYLIDPMSSQGQNQDPYLLNRLMNLPSSLVRVDIFYETLCPDCIRLFQEELTILLNHLWPYVDLHTYPFGKAKIRFSGNSIDIESQHGSAETYGNKLHACAIHLFGSDLAAFDFNSCMMGLHSNDTAADQCGELLNVDPEGIKQCAKSCQGDQLLLRHGIVSSLVPYHKNEVPTILVNGRAIDPDQLLRTVSSLLTNRPQICR